MIEGLNVLDSGNYSKFSTVFTGYSTPTLSKVRPNSKKKIYIFLSLSIFWKGVNTIESLTAENISKITYFRTLGVLQ